MCIRDSTGIASGVPQNKEQRHAYDCRCTKTDELPGGQVEGYFGLHLAEIARHGNISCQNFTSESMGTQQSFGDRAGLEQREAEQHGIPHARIYDRLTSMCAPVRFTGSNFRKETAQEKLERLKQLMKQRKESL